MSTQNVNAGQRGSGVSAGKILFRLAFVAIVLVAGVIIVPDLATWPHEQLGLLMLGLMVIAILLGFPAAFTLMGMGVIFTLIAYGGDVGKTLNLTVQRAYSVMTNEVLIAIPLFLFMGYLVERSNLVERLFRSLHLAMAGVPGALAVATMVTCALFSTATGIVGAVVTLMGLLALPVMLKAGYGEKLASGTIAAGGCLGILIPPSIMLIVYGATASVSIVRLYAGALLPGLMLAGLYILYITLLAKFRPKLAPPLSKEDRLVKLSRTAERFSQSGSRSPLLALLNLDAWKANLASNPTAALRYALIVLSPLLAGLVVLAAMYEIEGHRFSPSAPPTPTGFETRVDYGQGTVGGARRLAQAAQPEVAAKSGVNTPQEKPDAKPAKTPTWVWMLGLAVIGVIGIYYAFLSYARVEIVRLLFGSVFPLTFLILTVLGSIVFGLATPTEAAALGALGGFLLAVAYGHFSRGLIVESVFLTTKTSAMVCWLFVGTSIFSAAFALLGGHQPIERWVLGMDLSPLQFLILAQLIIFVLGWPLDWTEIVVIFVPIFLPLLPHFGIDPLFFGILIALNLQTAFLTPPMAMAAFYLKGVAPAHIKLTSIFLGIAPFVAIQVLALVLLYVFPEIALWLPSQVY